MAEKPDGKTGQPVGHAPLGHAVSQRRQRHHALRVPLPVVRPSTRPRGRQVPDGSDADTDAGNERNVRVSGLTNGTIYRFELRAVNSAGAGPEWGEAAATPNAPPTSTDHTVTTLEDRLYLFTNSDWHFSDEDQGDSLQWVILESTPPGHTGTTYIGRSGRGPMSIPAPNWNGSTQLRFKLSDGKDESGIYTITINVTPVNDPATGKPTISGTRQVGQALTLSTADIADVDGLPDSFAYQWLRVDSDGASNPVAIPGATASTYTVTAADVGKRIRVRVSFTDRGGYSEEVTSDPTRSRSSRGVPNSVSNSVQNSVTDRYGHREEVTSDAIAMVQARNTINAAPTASDATVVTDEDTDYVIQAAISPSRARIRATC